MDIKSVIRTSAIIYADESNFVSTKTIQRKFIEAILVENQNSAINVNDLISAIEKKFGLYFTLQETIEIINKADKEIFTIQQNGKSVENTIISLTGNRFTHLQNKEATNDFDQFTKEFSEECLDCNIPSEVVNEILLKYLYELLNTNILLYSNILKPTTQAHNFTIDSDKFTPEEIIIINEFLQWEKPDKNKALFKLISYCIEYSLVANHSSGDNTYLASLRNKYFYLDNNILYRAIGINGETRKRRTNIFLKKCIDSGQQIVISKYSKNEFLATIDYHIGQLKKVPFGKINPKLFSKYCISPSFYEFYHTWRDGRLTYGFDSFYAHIISEYENLIRIYKITEDYKIPFDESSLEDRSKIDAYKEEIKSWKGYGYDDSHLFDAQNSYFIEKKRGLNDKNIQDTKFYLITTDQKLKNWDDNHSNNQSLTMLPSHWMGLLLKYFSRTDDDFKSFVSFLKLKQHENVIDENNLQIVLAGISEITEDFKRQSTVMERMVERKFAGIVDTKSPEKTKEEAKKFAKEQLEQELEESHLKHVQELEELETKNSEEKLQIKNSNKKLIDELFTRYEHDKLTAKYDETCRELKRLGQLFKNANVRAEKTFKSKKFRFAVLPVTSFLTLLACVIIFDWNIMEKITWIASFLIFGLTYAYLGIYGKNFNPEKYFIELRNQCKLEACNEFMVDLNEISELEDLKKQLEKQITPPSNV